MDEKETARTQARYQRIAPLYDAMEVLAERRYADWRPRLWSLVQGPKVLEVGVGTGKNMPYYPPGLEVTAIDLTPGMLERAKVRAAKQNIDVMLQLGDVQNLHFADNTFDDVVATFVFCSVPDPILGLDEITRVLKPNGRLLLLEHVRSTNPLLGALMDLLDPVTVRVMGPHINRQTGQNVQQSHLRLERSENVGLGDIFKLIVASKS
jgi:ubiquinone/menaquinone biosynthesis C-methylase UbiE